jgi:Bacterial TSP3 repeat
MNFVIFERAPLIPAMVCLSMLLARAQVDSGGGIAPLGGGVNHSSIGAPIQTDGPFAGLIDILYPPAPALDPEADTDGDGLPDSWEVAQLGSLNSGANVDVDGDGTTNMMEYLAGTNPQSSASVFRPTTHMANGKLILTVPTVSNRSYRLWGTENLNSAWTQHDTITGDGSTVQWEYLISQSTRYFLRIEILIALQN